MRLARHVPQMNRTLSTNTRFLLTNQKRCMATQRCLSFEQALDFADIISPGCLFEKMVNQSFRKAIRDGANKNQTLDKVLPFLRETKLERIPCVPLEEKVFHTETKVMKKNAEKKWTKILSTVPLNTLSIFEEQSHGPDSLIVIPNRLNNGRVLLCIQSKNAELSFSELLDEIEKTSKILVNEEDEVILVVAARDVQRQLSTSRNIWYPGETVSIPKRSKTAVLPDRMTTILVTGENLTGFLGEFAEILSKFNKEKSAKQSFYPHDYT